VRIGITTFGADGGRSGIGRYVTSILKHLPLDGHTAEVLAHPSERDALVGEAPVTVLPVSEKWRSPLVNVAWHQAALPRLSRSRRWDVAFLTAANRRSAVGLSCSTVGTVHDLAAARLAGKYDRAREFYVTHVIPKMVSRLSRVVTVSEASRRDILELTGADPSRVHVIPLGVDHQLFTPGDPVAAKLAIAALGFDKPFILYVSRLEHPGKNHVTLIRAFTDLKRRTGLPHELVCVGSDWSGAPLVHAAAAQSEFGHAIRFTGYVAGSRLPDFYRAAAAVAFPSLYEGFGLPVIEAMASGVPVACANTSSLPEVAGDAALLFDPLDDLQLSQQLELLLTDPVTAVAFRTRGLARAQQFSWDRAARQTMDVLIAAREGR